jgi:hypothetical protein
MNPHLIKKMVSQKSLFLNRNFNLESHEPTPNKKNGISKIVILKPQF